ncbi:MAG TPA: TIM44-like domain-containing protein [Methylocystis sp.]|nr:TIM44-like domain-containing protein [Methylocystis sp.]
MSSVRARKRPLFKILLIASALALSPALAEAGMGDLFRGGAGSRGSRTFTPSPPTRTAPTTATPIQRSITTPPSSAQQTPLPGMATPGFGRGFMGGLAGGLLGAGLFGMLTGHGLWGGMMGFASFIGLLLQIGLLFLLGSFAYAYWRNRQGAPAMAGSPRPGASAFAGGGGFGPAPRRPRVEPIQLAAADFPAFERALTQIQDAYSREDGAALGRIATAEMAGYLQEELIEKRRRGLVNRISDVKLLQGDLSEAWREGADEYATVAMRFSMIDVTQERESGKIVSGDPSRPTQSTEVWTFRRRAGAGPEGWVLSAMQQTEFRKAS